MKSRSLRPAAIAAGPVLLLVLGTVFACDNGAGPSDDDWATQAVVHTKVRMQLDLMSNGVPDPGQQAHIDGDAQSRTLPSQAARQAMLARRGRIAPEIRSAVTKHGDTITVGLVPNENGAPMKRMYVFRNRTIQLIYNPTYARSGRGWIRTKGALMLFDDSGKAALRLEAGSTLVGAIPAGRSGGRVRTPFDLARVAASLFAPKAALASEVMEDSDAGLWCWRQVWDVLVAEAELGVALLSDYIVFKPCLDSRNVKSGPCLALLGTGVVTLKTLTNVFDKYDALTKCDLNSFMNGTTGGGGGTLDPSKFAPDDPKTTNSTTTTVAEFIAAAERNGTYSCSDDGNTCTYYAE